MAKDEEEVDKKAGSEFAPKGTMLILAIFLVTTIVLWLTVYFILLSRGVTV